MELEAGLRQLLVQLASIGVSNDILGTALDYLEYREYGVCIEYVADVLFETSHPIPLDVYSNIETLAIMMHLPEASYSFLKQLLPR